MGDSLLDIRAVLSQHPVFSRLRNEALDAVLKAATTARLRRGDPVWRAGERAAQFTLVGQGLVAVYAPCGPAREMMLGIASPGEGVGEATTLLGETHRDDAYGFTTPTEVVQVPRDLVVDLLERSGSMAMAYAQRLAALRSNADRRVVSLTQTSDARIAEVLLALVARFCDPIADGAVIPVRITRAQLASMVGTTVETAIRTVSKWTREGLIATRDEGMTVLDLATLARIAGIPPERIPALHTLTRIA